jgi:hypothetical protein
MSTKEEKLESLPVGHPQAGYLGPKPGASLDAGTLSDDEQDTLDDAVAEWEAQAKAIAQNEDAVVKAERGEVEEEKPAAKSKTGSTSSSSSSSG